MSDLRTSGNSAQRKFAEHPSPKLGEYSSTGGETGHKIHRGFIVPCFSKLVDDLGDTQEEDMTESQGQSRTEEEFAQTRPETPSIRVVVQAPDQRGAPSGAAVVTADCDECAPGIVRRPECIFAGPQREDRRVG
jgi:hypothetical protein